MLAQIATRADRIATALKLVRADVNLIVLSDWDLLEGWPRVLALRRGGGESRPCAKRLPRDGPADRNRRARSMHTALLLSGGGDQSPIWPSRR